MIKNVTYSLLIILIFFSCQSKKQDQEIEATIGSVLTTDENTEESLSEEVTSTPIKKDFSALIPKSFIIFEELHGDLNKDGVDDLVLIIKDTDKENIIDDEYRGRLDRNRRGIIIVFKKGDKYEPIIQNQSCFSSENEDGGVYFAPELFVAINDKGNLEIDYGHGRYGHWGYIFRYQNNDFEMIGFSSESNRGPVGLSKTSINFSTKKMLVSVNTDENCESGEEKWEDKWTDIQDKPLIKLSNIEDFDSISLDKYTTESN